MICYFANRKMEILGLASTDLPKSLLITDDGEMIDIDTGVVTLSFTLSYQQGQFDLAQTLSTVGNYVLMQDEQGQGRFYTIITKEHDRKNRMVDLYCEDAGLDLLNEAVTPWGAPEKAQPISYYVNKAIYDSGFEIGINEVENLTRTLSWEGEATATERLLSIATQFDHAEIGFSFAIDKMKVTHKYVDIYKKRGTDTHYELRLDNDIDNIVDKESIEKLATALRVTGGIPEGTETPIDLRGYSYDDGDIYTDGIYLKSRAGLARWSRYLSETGNDEGHITVNYNYDTLSQSELCNRAITQLKKLCKIDQNFEVDIVKLPSSIQIGDTINIIDEEGKLYLQARVLKLEKSRANGTNKATLGDFLIEESGVDARLQALADKVATIKSGDTYYPWVRYADDDQGNGLSATPLNKKYMAIKYAKNQPTPSDDPKDYTGLWTKIIGDDGKQGVPGPPGQDGLPKYMWRKYADNHNGYNMSDDPTGKKYIGLAFNKDTETPSNNPQDYSWSAMYDETKLNEIENKLKEIVYAVMSPIPPKNPEIGQQWWKQNAENLDEIVGLYIWDGTEWIAQTIQQGVLNIVKLNAVDITGSTVSSTNIIGSSIQNTFRITDQENILSGTITLKDAKLIIDYVIEGTEQRGITQITPSHLSSMVFIDNENKDVLSSYNLSSSGLVFFDKDYGIGGIGAENLTPAKWINLPLNSGWQVSEGSTPQYRKIRNLDGSYTVELRGQIARVGADISTDTGLRFATIPDGYRPSTNKMAQVAGNRPFYGGRITVLTDGQMQAVAPQPTSYLSLDQVRYVL